MPPKTEAQRRAAGAALAAVRGQRSPRTLGKAARDMYHSMSEADLRDFARKPNK